jgi:tetratricopeptide (TPR) repeat protein
MSSKFVQSLQTLISEHQIEPTLYLLSDFFKDKDDDLFKECLIHKGNLTELELDKRTRTESFEELELSENRLMMAVTELVFKVDDFPFDDNLYNARALAAFKKERKMSDWTNNLMNDKNPRNLLLMSGLSIAVLTGIYFFYFKKPKAKPSVEVKSTVVYVTQKSNVDRFKNASDLRANYKFDEAIQQCDTILQSESCYWEAFNLKAECQMHKSLMKPDNLPDLEKAIAYARQAITCNPADNDGLIYSTLAQIYGEMGSDANFYKYLDSTLTRHIEVWEYLNQPGFNKYRDKPQFKKVIAFAKEHNH